MEEQLPTPSAKESKPLAYSRRWPERLRGEQETRKASHAASPQYPGNSSFAGTSCPFFRRRPKVRASLKTAGGGRQDAENRRNWIHLERTVNWTQITPKKNAINHCGLWRYEYAQEGSNL